MADTHVVGPVNTSGMGIPDLRCEPLAGTLDEDPEGFYGGAAGVPLRRLRGVPDAERRRDVLADRLREGRYPDGEDGRLRVSRYFVRVDDSAVDEQPEFDA